MKKRFALIILIIIVLYGCATGSDDVQRANMDDVHSLYIEQGSHDLIIESVERPDVEAIYGRGVTLEKSEGKVTIGVQKSLLTFGPKLNLGDSFKVTIPNDYNGKVVIEGNSGDISSEHVSIADLEIMTKSGDVQLTFSEFRSNVHIVSGSGNVEIVIQEEEPNVTLSTKTRSGNSSIFLPVSLNENEDGKEVSGVSGQGEYQLMIDTKSGDIRVRNY